MHTAITVVRHRFHIRDHFSAPRDGTGAGNPTGRQHAGDAADGGVAHAFDIVGQELKHGRRVAAGAGRFALSDADLPLGHGQARETVAHEQNVFAVTTKRIGNGQGEQGRTHAHQRRIVAHSRDHDRLVR